MTIQWRISNHSLEIWLSETEPESSPDRVLEWEYGRPVDYPQEVLDVAYEEFRGSLSPPMDLKYALALIADASFEQIERID